MSGVLQRSQRCLIGRSDYLENPAAVGKKVKHREEADAGSFTSIMELTTNRS